MRRPKPNNIQKNISVPMESTTHHLKLVGGAYDKRGFYI